MAASIRIGRIFGIPIYMHLTFFIILPLFIYVFSAPPSQVTILGIPLSFTDLHVALWIKYLFGTAAASIVAIALTSGNVGTLVRHRSLAVPYLLWLSLAGLCELLSRAGARGQAAAFTKAEPVWP